MEIKMACFEITLEVCKSSGKIYIDDKNHPYSIDVAGHDMRDALCLLAQDFEMIMQRAEQKESATKS